MKKEEGLTLTTRERFARIKILHRLIELETELQLKQISNLLKNVSYEYARYDRWWGGAVQVGPEQDGNWIWIESGAPVQKWAWGRLYTGSRRNDTNNFVFQFFQYVDK